MGIPEVKYIIEITKETIKNKSANLLSERDINFAISIHEDLIEIINMSENIVVPNYIEKYIALYMKKFLDSYNGIGRNLQNGGFEQLYATLYYGNQNGNYPIPFIMIWFKSETNPSAQIIEEQINEIVGGKVKSIKNQYTTGVKELEKVVKDANTIIARLNQESGKITVQKYADIFEDQSRKHSGFEFSGGWTKDVKFRVGAAQIWLISGIIGSLFLVFLFTRIDNFLNVTGDSWTPENVTHLIGRFVLVSLLIFFISFSFKQYRINKHLHTLNTHRSNTLKSFEYLTKAPDKLEPASYNAILMKVAESIYESGNTGYINSSDSHAEMPSIIDMTKIINSGAGK